MATRQKDPRSPADAGDPSVKTTFGRGRNSRYSVTFSKLMKLVVEMSEDQQRILLEKAEELIRSKAQMLQRPARRADQFQNERRYPRKPCTIVVNFSSGSRYYTSTIQDLSIDGAFIQTRAAFDTGEPISIAFSFPGFPDVFRLQAIVRRTTNRGIGVQFNSLSHLQRSRVKALLEWMKGQAL
ncbi:MAG: PilZ domain-containing protein [Desulfobacterales bacterium]